MKRHRQYADLDTPETTDGDVGWRGVDERTDPAQLAPGFMAYAENSRFRNQIAEARAGDNLILMMKTNGDTPFGEIHTALRFEEPVTGQELWLIAADGGMYHTAAGNVAVSVSLPAGVTLTSATAVQLVQCFNVVILLRGDTADPLVLRNFTDGFEFINEQTSNGTGTLPIPRSSFGYYFQNRLLLVHDGDEVAVSDLLDYTRYSVFNDFKINKGDNDRLVAIHALNDATLLMLKDQSVWVVENVYGDLANIRLRNVTRKYGCLAPWSVVDYGKDVAWLSDRGVVTLRLTEQNEYQGTALSLSDPLTRTMARLNWAWIGNAVAESWDNKLYFALPLDEAQVLSATNLATTGGVTYSTINLVLTGLTVGAKYMYTQNAAADLYLINGNHRLDGSGEFIATGTTAQLFGDNGEAVTATVYEVLHEGVNNGVVVYDNVTQAWAGLDTRAGLNIKRWVKLTYHGRLRLGYVSWDGETRIYEEGAEDEIFQEVADAYVDVLLVDYPGAGVTLQVGGGTTVTSNIGASQNTGADNWGANSTLGLANIGANLWSDNDRGFAATNGTQWTSGGLTLQQIDRGVRFRAGSTTLPAIEVDAVVITASGIYGTNADSNEPEGCVYVDCIHGTLPTVTPIATVWELRGYHGRGQGRKRFVDAHLDLATWDPTYTVTRLLDGVAESKVYKTAKTRDRASYMNGDAWDATNAGADHETAHREDYSIVLDDGQVGFLFGATGAELELMQDFQESFGLTQEEGRACQLKITNTTGRMKLKAATVNAHGGTRAYLETT